jgi:hypothetical protein
MSTINETVEELLAIQSKIADLNSREIELRNLLREQLMQENRQTAYIQSSQGMIKVQRHAQVKIIYDEPLLLERLGTDSYRQLASVNRNKLRSHWDELPQWLGDHFDTVASLDRKKIKTAVESGAVAGQTFAGAFSKTSHEILTVTRLAADKMTPQEP